MTQFPYIGEIFALTAPVCWSFAVILFRRTGRVVPPLALNLFKNIVAAALFMGTMAALGQEFLSAVPHRDYLLLLVSGMIGIGISDALFFMTLNRLGAGLQSIVNTSYSPSIILLSLMFLGERFTWVQFLGVALILCAVLAITRIRNGRTVASRKDLTLGILLGLSASVTQAVSIVMIKPLLNESPIIWANSWRLIGGIAMSILLLPILPERRRALATLRNLRIWPVMIPAAVLGTYVSLLFWLGGMKYTQASTASALNQTSTLWTFILAALLLKEPVTWKRVTGLALGLGGVALVTFGGGLWR